MTARGTIVPDIKVRRPPSPTRLLFAAALGAVAVAALVVGGFWVFSPSPAQIGGEAPRVVATAPAPEPAATLPVDPNSGFDVTTDPPGSKVRLDGQEIGTAPLRVRSLSAGKHLLEIGGIAGHKPTRQELVVEQGRAQSLAIKLEKEEGPPAPSVVKLTSEPPGARVTLIGGGGRTVLGVTPTEAKLEGGKSYEVLYELDGYAAVTKAIGPGEAAVAAVLTKGAVAAPEPVAVAAPAPTPPPKQIRAPAPPPRRESRRTESRHSEPRIVEPPRPRPERTAAVPKVTTPGGTTPIETAPSSGATREPASTGPRTVEMTGGTGKLTLGAKPPCTVIIDGKDTGRTTPIREIEVKSGPVQITLVNSEFGIRESFTVQVKPGETSKVIKDYSDKLPE
jgi:hypothetical protein